MEGARISIHGADFPVEGLRLPEVQIGDRPARVVYASAARLDVAAVRLRLRAEGGREGRDEGVILAESQNFTRTLVNEPGNRMTPTILAQRAAEMAQEVGLKCEVFGMDKLHELKMGAFIGVAQGLAIVPGVSRSGVP